jgi:hypothetical protein
MNKALAGNNDSSNSANMADIVSKSLDRHTLGVDALLRRNMATRWLVEQVTGKSMASKGDDYDSVRKAINSLSEKELQGMVGKVYHEKAISSASYDSNNSTCVSKVAQNTGICRLMLRAPAETKALVIDRNSSCPSEREVILQKGATYVIRSVKRHSDGSLTIKADLISCFKNGMPSK